MVCQASSQTRFRALKHESGIAGRPTIIVRVIACFQPLQNCQAEYFRQLLKPVTIKCADYSAKEWHLFQQLSASKPPDSHHMALLQLEQKHPFLANVASPGQCNTNLRGLNTGQEKPYLKGVQCASSNVFGLPDKPIDTSATLKRFLIFDQSVNHTRLFVSPSFTPQVVLASKTPATANGLGEKVATEMDNQLKPEIQEKWEGSDLADEEGEMREDTEEINALLYSSGDEYSNNYESDGDDDEVTSTTQTPMKIGERYDKEKLLAEFLGEEVASSNDSPKRQKLSDEKYKKSPLMSAQCSYGDDLESSCAGDIDWSKREKKVKIRNALKILESIIPGLKSDDPISIIDEAIVYLKSMRTELSQPESDSVTFS